MAFFLYKSVFSHSCTCCQSHWVIWVFANFSLKFNRYLEITYIKMIFECSDNFQYITYPEHFSSVIAYLGNNIQFSTIKDNALLGVFWWYHVRIYSKAHWSKCVLKKVRFKIYNLQNQMSIEMIKMSLHFTSIEEY